MKFDWSIFNPFDIGVYQRTLALVQFLPIVLAGLIALVVWLKRRGKSTGYLVCVCLFAAYLWVFTQETIFPFPIFLDSQGFRFPYGSLHLVPALIEGEDPNFQLGSKQVWGNFLAGVPFGFAFPFIASPKNRIPARVILFGMVLAITPEFIQLLQNWFFEDFVGRAVDIDDVWLCFAGTLAGYAILQILARIYRLIAPASLARLPVWNHFHDVLMSLAAPRQKRTNSPSSTASTSHIATT